MEMTFSQILVIMSSWTMSEMVKYKGSVLLKRPKSGPVYHHLWHSPCVLCKYPSQIISLVFWTQAPNALKHTNCVVPFIIQSTFQCENSVKSRKLVLLHNILVGYRGLFHIYTSRHFSNGWSACTLSSGAEYQMYLSTYRH